MRPGADGGSAGNSGSSPGTLPSGRDSGGADRLDRPPGEHDPDRHDDERRAGRPSTRLAAATTRPEPRLAAAAELQMSESVTPSIRVRSASGRPVVSIVEPAT